MTDLSKAFDCIPRDLIIDKLEAYGFHIDTLKLVHDHLSHRKQRVKVNDAYSSWKDIFYGDPQISIPGSLLFNIHLCDLFYFWEDLDIASYADDTAIYLVSKIIKKKESVFRALETSSSLLFGWFNNNFMKTNSDKSHLIMNCAEATTPVIDSLSIDFSKTVLLGITIDHELKFDDHAFARIAPFMNVTKKRIMKSFIEPQFRT